MQKPAWFRRRHRGHTSSAMIDRHTCCIELAYLRSCSFVKKLNSLYAGDEMPIWRECFMAMIGITTFRYPSGSQNASSSQMTSTRSSFPCPRFSGRKKETGSVSISEQGAASSTET